jgi:hypothetical protein
MAGVRIAVFSRDGAPLADVQRGVLPNDNEADFGGLFSILSPVAENDRPFLLGIRLGSFTVDICFDSSRFTFSIISSTAKAPLANANPILAWAAGVCFSRLIADYGTSKAVPQQVVDTFYSMIPTDAASAAHRVLSELLSAGVNYVAFVAQGHHVFLSLGETRVSASVFVFAWCAALQAADRLDDRDAVVVPEFGNVIVARFLPFVTLVAFLADVATQARMQCFARDIELVKRKLLDMFVAKDLPPQMPTAPKEGARPRRVRMGAPNPCF